MYHVIGSFLPINGTSRAVYLDHGREYFLDDTGQPVFGDWSDLDGQEILVIDCDNDHDPEAACD